MIGTLLAAEQVEVVSGTYMEARPLETKLTDKANRGCDGGNMCETF